MVDATGAVLITLAVIAGLVAIGVGTLKFFEKYPYLIESAKQSANGVWNYLVTWLTLLPYAVVLAGPVVDVFSSKYMYTKATLVGLATVAITYAFGNDWIAQKMSAWIPAIKSIDGTWNITGILGLAAWILIPAGLTATSVVPNNIYVASALPALGVSALLLLLSGSGFLGDTVPVIRTVSGDTSTSYAGITIEDMCATPGLGCFQTKFAPTGILLNTSILACHLFEAIDTGNTASAKSIGLAIAALLGFESMTQGLKGCISAYKYGMFASLVIAPLIGLGAGATAYYTMKRWGQESFTQPNEEQGVFHPPPPPEKPKSTSGKLETKIQVGKSVPVSDDENDQFVCEAYKDGELVTSTIVE